MHKDRFGVSSPPAHHSISVTDMKIDDGVNISAQKGLTDGCDALCITKMVVITPKPPVT